MKRKIHIRTVSIEDVLRSVKQLFVLVAFCFVTTGTTVMAQNLDDFKRAANGSSFNLIPFANMREKAKVLNEKVQRAKSSKKLDYKKSRKLKDRLLNKKKTLGLAIDRKEKEIDALKRRKDTKTDVLYKEEELEELMEELEENEKEISKLDKGLESTGVLWEKFFAARRDYRVAFEKAEKELDGAKRNPKDYLGKGATPKDIEMLDRYVDTIEKKIERGKVTHLREENEAKKKIPQIAALVKKTSI